MMYFYKKSSWKKQGNIYAEIYSGKLLRKNSEKIAFGYGYI